MKRALPVSLVILAAAACQDSAPPIGPDRTSALTSAGSAEVIVLLEPSLAPGGHAGNRTRAAEVARGLERWLAAYERSRLDADAARLVAQGVPDELAQRVARLSDSFSALDIVEVGLASGSDSTATVSERADTPVIFQSLLFEIHVRGRHPLDRRRGKHPSCHRRPPRKNVAQQPCQRHFVALGRSQRYYRRLK